MARRRVRVRVRVRIHRQLGGLRARLSEVVDKEVWGGQIGRKDVLRAITGKGLVAGTYGACLRECMQQGGDVKGCYQDCQQAHNIAQRFMDAWDMPSTKGGSPGARVA